MAGKEKRILVMSVDVDDDLYKKAGIKGPVIGRNENLAAASKLALADPTDSDANTIFESVKSFDSLKAEGYEVFIATLTGDSRLGILADREVARQLDSVLLKFKSDSCIFISDGASDEQILPIVQS